MFKCVQGWNICLLSQVFSEQQETCFQDNLTQVAQGGCGNSTFGGIQSLHINGPVKGVYFALQTHAQGNLQRADSLFPNFFSYIGV